MVLEAAACVCVSRWPVPGQALLQAVFPHSQHLPSTEPPWCVLYGPYQAPVAMRSLSCLSFKGVRARGQDGRQSLLYEMVHRACPERG